MHQGKGNRPSGGKNPRDNYCWKFNQGRCDDPNCPFEHCCSYCDGWGHGLHNCYKRNHKGRGSNGRDRRDGGRDSHHQHQGHRHHNQDRNPAQSNHITSDWNK